MALTLLMAMALVATGAGLTPKGYRLATGEDFQFDALRCDVARALGRYSGRTFCDMERIRADGRMGKRVPAGEYIVLQEVKQKTFKAIQCKKWVSAITAVCGAFSHSKLVEPLDILKPSRVTIGDSRDAAATRIITTEEGRQL